MLTTTARGSRRRPRATEPLPGAKDFHGSPSAATQIASSIWKLRAVRLAPGTEQQYQVAGSDDAVAVNVPVAWSATLRVCACRSITMIDSAFDNTVDFGHILKAAIGKTARTNATVQFGTLGTIATVCPTETLALGRNQIRLTTPVRQAAGAAREDFVDLQAMLLAG